MQIPVIKITGPEQQDDCHLACMTQNDQLCLEYKVDSAIKQICIVLYCIDSLDTYRLYVLYRQFST